MKKLGYNVICFISSHWHAGLVLMTEAFMSAAYHICPSNANYQFDTTFMFILGSLGLFKLLESRSPDHNPPLYKILFLQAAIIVLAVVGVVSITMINFSDLMCRLKVGLIIKVIPIIIACRRNLVA